jgi:hypothetical protein
VAEGTLKSVYILPVALALSAGFLFANLGALLLQFAGFAYQKGLIGYWWLVTGRGVLVSSLLIVPVSIGMLLGTPWPALLEAGETSLVSRVLLAWMLGVEMMLVWLGG